MLLPLLPLLPPLLPVLPLPPFPRARCCRCCCCCRRARGGNAAAVTAGATARCEKVAVVVVPLHLGPPLTPRPPLRRGGGSVDGTAAPGAAVATMPTAEVVVAMMTLPRLPSPLRPQRRRGWS